MKQAAGSILVLTLVFFLIFVLIMMAWLSFTTRQNNAVVNQEQEEQSFHLSEAGVNWAVHILNSGACTPAELDASEPVIQPLIDEFSLEEEDTPIGTYELTFEIESATQTSVRAVGYDLNVSAECQLIEATLESFTGVLGTKYRILSWDHKSTVSCGVPGAVRDPVC